MSVGGDDGDVVLRVRELGKRYRLGTRTGGGVYRYQSLRDKLGDLARHPLRALARQGDRGADDAFWALRDVTFDVRRGECVGIVGRNGAGKSTLLKILSQITRPTEGHVELRGRVGSLLEVGTGFHPELSGRENIYLNGAVLGMTRGEVRRKFDEIVDFSEIERFLDTPVKQYSSGMYTRLAFAVAAHLEPEILVVDEVLAVGDAQFQKKCLGKMKDVAGEGRTVLFVSHQMSSILELCGTGIHLAGGQVRTRGRIDAAVASYYASSAESRDGPVRLGGGLALVTLGVEPLSPTTRGHAVVDLALHASSERRVDFLQLLVYQPMFGRVCMVNLFAFGRGPTLAPSETRAFRVRLDPLLLMPGTYSLGLHVADNTGVRDYLDLATFDVVGDEALDAAAGYRPSLLSSGPLAQPAEVEHARA